LGDFLIKYNLYVMASGSASGPHGAIAAAHPAAAAAGRQMLLAGGSAVDAALAAQAVISVVLPQAAGLGGDLLALVHDGGAVHAINGTGCSAAVLDGPPELTGGSSVTVPGLVDGWLTLHDRWGRLPLADVLDPAAQIARTGVIVDARLEESVTAQRHRLIAGGADAWELLTRADGERWRQPQLAELLAAIAERGREAFYAGPTAQAIVSAIRRCGGSMSTDDLADHRTICPAVVSVPWHEGTAAVQPPASQGVLLAMALQKVSALLDDGVPVDDHALIEITGAVFASRDDCAAGAALLSRPLEVDLHRASGRTGPRAYLHTAGVAAADSTGQVVSSLISVFDDFGSGVFVPEAGLVLNNRAAGFTAGANAAAPAKRPVHTLAPAMVIAPDGVTALATPGADGQVQTLLQVLHSARTQPLAAAIAAPRWRSQDGELLIEQDHPGIDALADRGHRIATRPHGATVFGAVVAAGTSRSGAAEPFAVADWRRQTDCAGA
jgi:gamma-glutamyltranspeptidase / glutathione hydrolase